jgi:hypothetical protein
MAKATGWLVLSVAVWLGAATAGCTPTNNPSDSGGGGGGKGGEGAVAAVPSASADAQRLQAAVMPAIVSDSGPANYVRDVGARLVKAAGRRGDSSRPPPAVSFHLVRATGVTNVTTVGSGYVYVTVDLFRRCSSEEELAACLAHAYAHVYLRHRPGDVRADQGDSGKDKDDRAAIQIVLACAERRFSPSDEQAADRTGYELFARAGWNPEKYGDIFRDLSRGGDVGSKDASTLSQRADTQVPLPAASRDWGDTLVADADSFQNFQQRATKAASGGRGDSTQAELLISAMPSCLFAEEQSAQRTARDRLKAQLQQQTAPGPDPGNRGKGGRTILVPGG